MNYKGEFVANIHCFFSRIISRVLIAAMPEERSLSSSRSCRKYLTTSEG